VVIMAQKRKLTTLPLAKKVNLLKIIEKCEKKKKSINRQRSLSQRVHCLQ